MAPVDIKEMVADNKAVCHKNWTNGEKPMRACCRWEAESLEAIIDQLGYKNNVFYTGSEEMNDQVNSTSIQDN